MRGGNVLGRFDPELEVKSIRHGMTQDLQTPVGQEVQWFIYDPINTTVDPVYDVGASDGGRVWKEGFTLPVVNAYIYQNEQYQNDRGLYTVDTLRLFINYDVVMKFLPTLDTQPDTHLKDRVEFRGSIYSPNRVFPRGQVVMDYAILTVDLTQVKPEESINDVYTGNPFIPEPSDPGSLYPGYGVYPH